MPMASDLLAGASAGEGPQAGQDASTSAAASQEADAETLTRDEMMAAQRKPYKVPSQPCNLVWRDFPVGFADYFCIQGTGYAVVPNPKPAFCKSGKPLLFHTPKGTITSAMLLDESQPGGLYDTLYVDFNDNGDFQDDPVYRAQPYHGVAPDGGAVHAYFTNVHIMRVQARNIAAHVQIFLKDATWDTKGEPPYTICIIPQRWAVGTVQLKDRTAPAAVFDRNWNDSAIDQVGLNLSEYKDRYPRGDYLYLDPDGGQELRPGSLGNGPDNGSPHTILNEYLQIGVDTYKVKAAQSGDGVQLDLTPVHVPMGKIRVRTMYPGGRIIGLKTSLLLQGEPSPISAILVPADTYAFFGMDNALGDPATVEPDQTVDLPKSVSRPAPTPVRTLSAGEAAPPFETRTLDGKPLNLADYRGKVVVLDFWATWCGPCVKEIPSLKALYDRFGKGDRFVMVSLSIDDDAEIVQSFQKRQPMPWVQGFLDDKDRAQITEKYGVAAIPATFLIGPDGKILATDLRGEKTAEAVAKALGESNAGPDAATSPASQPVAGGSNAAEKNEGPVAALRIGGTVLLPDGKPAGGMSVYVCTDGRGFTVQNGRVSTGNSGSLRAQTDDDGRFSLLDPGRAFLIAAVSEAGYGEASRLKLAETGQIQMQAWARIEGTLRIGTKPGAGEPIVVYAPGDGRMQSRDIPNIKYGDEVTADASGRFVIERVVPKDVIVARRIETTLAANVLVFIEPGKTYQVELGGTGRPVTGRIVVPEEVAENVDLKNCLADASRVLPELAIPEPIKAKGGLAIRDWEANWLRTPEGKARRLADRIYSFMPKPDGSFRIEDLPAGTYRLYCNLSGRAPGKDQIQAIGRVNYEFVIAEMPGGRSDEPLDLGDIAAEVLNRIDVGSEAAPFEATTFDGKTIRSSDYRGRCMLLTFWSVKWWDNTKETDNLKALYERFGKDGRLAMISFNIDEKPDEAKKHIEEKGLAWPQAYLGDLNKTLLPGAYGAYRFPAIILVGADGKILAMGLRGEKICEAVEITLAAPSAPASGEAR
jgi:peroxiredoxin